VAVLGLGGVAQVPQFGQFCRYWLLQRENGCR